MAGLFVMPRFIKKGVAPAQFEGRLYSTCIKTKQLSWTDVNATAGNPVLLKNFSIDSEWPGRTIVGIVPVSIRGYNTSSFVPSIYRQYSQSYFVTTVSQSYDIVVNVLYI